jgi:AcrR family transcriptional regulator
MATEKPQENIIQGTQKHIIDTARRLFSEYSYLGVSMSDIAKKLNITKAALYYHFTGKADIYKKVLDEVFDNLSLSITEALNEETTDRKLHKLITNYLNFGFKEKNLIKALLLKLSQSDRQIVQYIVELREKTTDLMQPIIKEVMASKKITQAVDCRLVTSLLTGMMDGLLLEYSFLNKKIDAKKISTQIITVMGLLKNN